MYSPRPWVSNILDRKGSYALLWAVSLAARGKITVSGICKRLNYFKIFIEYTKIYKICRGSHAVRGPRGGDPCPKTLLYFSNLATLDVNTGGTRSDAGVLG